MNDEYTSTNETDEMPGLTLDAVLEARERLKPIIYYRTSEYLPIVDSNGDPLVVCVPASVHLESAVARKETMISYMHPENLSAFLKKASQRGYIALARD